MTNSTSTLKAWSKAVLEPGQEFPLTQCTLLSGSIPEGLKGTLYRNGPGSLERGGVRAGHWFDGDGAILAVHFADKQAHATYRYVQTQGRQEEIAANRYLFPNYGMKVPGPFWLNWGKSPKNSANTSVLPLGDRLLALWEGGSPHALNLQTLETIGKDSLSLPVDTPYSAHPKIDPNTGEIYNFGITIGTQTTLNLYRSLPQGQVVQKSFISLKGIPLIHDFVLAGRYLIFFIPPVRLDLLPIAMGFNSYSQAMKWQPELGTEILVIDRQDLSCVNRFFTDAFYQWHFANGYTAADGSVVVAWMRFEDWKTNQHLQEVSTGRTHTQATATLWQMRFEPQQGKIIETQQLHNDPCEFPVVSPHRVGQPWNRTFFLTHRLGVDYSQELFGSIGCFNHENGKFSASNLGANFYPSEPIYVNDSQDSSLAWLISVVYNGNTHASEVWIYQSDRLEGEPICRLQLPKFIPLGFHGCWRPL